MIPSKDRRETYRYVSLHTMKRIADLELGSGCNTQETPDGPLWSGGWSALVTPRYLSSCGPRLSFPPPSPHIDQRRAELVRSLHRRPLPSISFLRSPYFDSLREHLPQHLLHLPQPPASSFSAGIAPATAGHHWSPLEALLHRRSASPSSSARTNHENGFVVSYLCSLVFFPFRCGSPAQGNGRRRRRACCHLSCDVKKMNRGRSAQGARTIRKLE